ncbi:YbhB/YbcL family Raf kinase inhibitor-like protein [Mesorhizobium sp. Root695]|uniref:YbhB/YbcL family Raf kinase inhibitor-like protein n=1 Tax=Mesorhizobium sp. Root695 TaxID=1736589 RepID=UPI000A8E6604|nr:YbhB/YbcL family Raf kinase inhibitor-like protein [Mesorhizobium sp. Root695]
MDMMFASPAFDNDAVVPRRYTCGGEDVSPPFKWQGAPEGTKSFALTCHDPDAPSGTFFHWAIFDIPSSQLQLAERLPRMETFADGTKQAVNDFGRIGYAGPCPPKGHGIHHYHFRLFALDVDHLDLDKADCRQVQVALQAHILAFTEIVGRFQR